MSHQSLDGIRRENIKSIFACICEREKISRHEISEATGLSLMTVGKMTDVLCERGVIEYERSETTSVGRKAKSIRLSSELYELVCEIAGDAVKVSFRDLSLNDHGGFGFGNKEDTDGFFGELMRHIFAKGYVGKLIGGSVVYEKEDDIELAEKLAQICKGALSVDVAVADAVFEKAEGASMSHADVGSLIYLARCEKGARAVFIGRDGYVHLGNIHATARELATRISSVVDFLSPDEIFVEDGVSCDIDDIVVVDKERASELLHRGSAARIRLEHIIK